MFQMFTYQNVLQRLYELIYSDDLYGWFVALQLQIREDEPSPSFWIKPNR